MCGPIGKCSSAIESLSRRLPPSDTILVNLSLANLLTSLFCTVPIFVSHLGLDVSLALDWCRLFLLLWVWWRAVGCWVTLQPTPGAVGPLEQQRKQRRMWVGLELVYGGQPGLIPAGAGQHHPRPRQRHGGADGHQLHHQAPAGLCVGVPLGGAGLGIHLQLPGPQRGGSPGADGGHQHGYAVHTGQAHLGRHLDGRETQGELDRHVVSERKAGHVIMMLFVVCWALQVAVVTYYNHNGGHHVEGLLTVSHFSASVCGLQPHGGGFGKRQLRRRIMGMIVGCVDRVKCQREEVVEESKSPDTRGKKAK
ncbi:hypothetical protein J4Q44_G00083910 [Coregonus suidteri]|uniref:Uncharacterized protein n=1 Tax=Coregonus suidteri TaxID=861788 RepID=A0AAN8MCT7_9TELE